MDLLLTVSLSSNFPLNDYTPRPTSASPIPEGAEIRVLKRMGQEEIFEFAKRIAHNGILRWRVRSPGLIWSLALD